MTTGDLLCGRTCQALFMIFPTSCTHSPCGRLDGSVSPDLCWWLHDPWSSLAPHDLLAVVTARGHTPDPACALGACEARGGPPLLISGSRCEPVPPNAWATPAQNRSRSPRDRGAHWDGLARHRHLEHSARWEFSRPQAAPQGDQDLPRQRHHPNFPEARTTLAKPSLLPLGPRALRLKAAPAPRNLDGHGPHITIPSLRNPQFPGSLATLGGRRRQARSRPYLLGRLPVPPRKAFQPKEPGTIEPTPAQRC